MTIRRGAAVAVACASLLVVVLSGAVHAAVPAGWQGFEVIGLRFATPPTLEVLAQDDDMLMLGEPDWVRFAHDFDFERPTGLAIEVRHEIVPNLLFLTEHDGITRLEAAVIIGNKTFDAYRADDVWETSEGPLELHGRILLSRSPLARGHVVLINVTVADGTREAAHELIESILATFEAVDPATFTDEVPLTRGLDGALEVLVPRGMGQNWDRAYFFRMQSHHDLGRSNVQVKLGDATPPGSRSAEVELRMTLEDLSPAATITRDTVLGEGAWRIDDVDLDDRRVVAIVFERCFPDDTLVLLQYRETPEWREQHGSLEVIFETLTLAFPEGSAPCSARHLDPIRNA